MDNNLLHKFWWLYIPVAFAIFQAVIETTLPGDVLSAMHSEGGPHELLQFLIMALAFIWSIRLLLLKPWKISPLLGVWVGVAALCSLYVAGEEMSWGQHVFEWSSSEFWHNINDQGETNLHNTSSWLDQKPRLALLIGAVVGGLVIPALQRFKPKLIPRQFNIIYPPAILGITAALALTANLLDKLAEAVSGTVLLARGSEVEEIYLFYFVLLYLLVLRRRVMQN